MDPRAVVEAQIPFSVADAFVAPVGATSQPATCTAVVVDQSFPTTAHHTVAAHSRPLLQSDSSTSQFPSMLTASTADAMMMASVRQAASQHSKTTPLKPMHQSMTSMLSAMGVSTTTDASLNDGRHMAGGCASVSLDTAAGNPSSSATFWTPTPAVHEGHNFMFASAQNSGDSGGPHEPPHSLAQLQKPQTPPLQQAPPADCFEENFNVLSEDKRMMLSIPVALIEPTTGSQKYLQQGTSACYTFRFQLCRGYRQSGRCVHRHNCAFIHSRHVLDPQLAALVRETTVHLNQAVASLEHAHHPRHKEGIALQVYDATAQKNLLVDSGSLYVTHGSTAAIRVAVQEQEDAARPGSTGTDVPTNHSSTTLASIRLQFCLHFDKGMCARGASCNFVHRILVQPQHNNPAAGGTALHPAVLQQGASVAQPAVVSAVHSHTLSPQVYQQPVSSQYYFATQAAGGSTLQTLAAPVTHSYPVAQPFFQTTSLGGLMSFAPGAAPQQQQYAYVIHQGDSNQRTDGVHHQPSSQVHTMYALPQQGNQPYSSPMQFSNGAFQAAPTGGIVFQQPNFVQSFAPQQMHISASPYPTGMPHQGLVYASQPQHFSTVIRQ